MPKVSILTNTFKRADMLGTAIASVLKQDFEDFEYVIIDDCSPDDTEAVVRSFNDPRIRYFRNEQNVGGIHGDRILLRRFIHELSRGQYFVYLCDDDFWRPSDLLSRQVRILDRDPEIAAVYGGVGYRYPTPLEAIPEANAANHTNVPIPGVENSYFPQGLFPPHMTGEAFLNAFADDPKNRNHNTGALLIRKESAIRGGILKGEFGSRWQLGYEVYIALGLTGNIAYIDEPCLVCLANPASLSYNIDQNKHLEDCLRAVDIGFASVETGTSRISHARQQEIRRRLMHRILFDWYLMHQLFTRIFTNQPLKEMAGRERIPPARYLGLCREKDVPVHFGNLMALMVDALPLGLLNFAPLRRLVTNNRARQWFTA